MSKPKYTYHDTPKGTMRTTRSTGKRTFIRIKSRSRRK